MANWFGLVELLFSFGVAIAFFVWQAWELKRDNAKAAGRHEIEPESEKAAPHNPNGSRGKRD
jgi:hypothetical protein